ncbi:MULTISPECIES: type I methionyl aminopeptidase [Anaeromyxobacter]|uniref:type I methionyl aminopeptidase n=1 Tax=Anaeromyxobacter TaxID=161492 RepID=UPI001F57B434|nr:MULTISPECIES: type I methionyl aminopeptidase [unclassified Anaeromyxobacter]
MDGRARERIDLRTRDEIARIREACLVVHAVLDELEAAVAPGVTTAELDRLARTRARDRGAEPAFLGYHGYPASLCVSVNDEVVHGIPSEGRVLREGDIVGLDFGVVLGGWFGDSARTVPVGRVSAEATRLLEATRESLRRAIAAAGPAAHVGDLGAAVQACVEPQGYSVVRDFVGHGIGRRLHEAPQVPNFGTRGSGTALRPGMVLAIEPMVNAGGRAVETLEDGWTAVTADGSLSAHFEHTVAITEDGPEVLTLGRGGPVGGSR